MLCPHVFDCPSARRPPASRFSAELGKRLLLPLRVGLRPVPRSSPALSASLRLPRVLCPSTETSASRGRRPVPSRRLLMTGTALRVPALPFLAKRLDTMQASGPLPTGPPLSCSRWGLPAHRTSWPRAAARPLSATVRLLPSWGGASVEISAPESLSTEACGKPVLLCSTPPPPEMQTHKIGHLGAKQMSWC